MSIPVLTTRARRNMLFVADNIPDSGLPIQPQVGHFPFLHDPAQFNSMEGGIAERIPLFSAAESMRHNTLRCWPYGPFGASRPSG